MKCEVCQTEIPMERLEILPHTTTCVRHSTEQAYVGAMDFHHKSTSVLVKVKPNQDPEAFRRMKRAYHRER